MTQEEYNQLYQLGTALERNRRAERENEATSAAFHLLALAVLLLPFFLLYKALDDNHQTHPLVRIIAFVCSCFLFGVIGLVGYAFFSANNPTSTSPSRSQEAAPVAQNQAFQVANPAKGIAAQNNPPPKKPPVYPGLTEKQIPPLELNAQGKPVIPETLLKGSRYLTVKGSRLGLNSEGVLTHLPKLPKGSGSLNDPLAKLLVDDAQQYWFFYFEYWRLYDIHSYLHRHQLDPQSMLSEKDRLTWLDLSGPNFTTSDGVSLFWAPMPG